MIAKIAHGNKVDWTREVVRSGVRVLGLLESKQSGLSAELATLAWMMDELRMRDEAQP